MIVVEYRGLSRYSNDLESSILSLLKDEIESFEKFFTLITGFKPWSMQRHWIKKLISGENFAMIAPTGMGKSTLLTVYALYRSCTNGWKVYILSPTLGIAKQLYSRLIEMSVKARELGLCRDISIVMYDSSRKSCKDRIARGEFDILITSAAFLHRNYDLVIGKHFDLVIADDLDSLLRDSKSVDRILKLLGFSDEEIDIAFKIVRIRQNLVFYRLSKDENKLQELRDRLYELQAELKLRLSTKKSQFIVASATGRIRGLKSKILRELLGFEGGALFEYWRNVEDYYVEFHEISKIYRIVKRLGSGIIFISKAVDRNFVDELLRELSRNGIRYAIARDHRVLDKLRNGEIDVVIGSASYYGLLVRGIDEPQLIKYTIFIGTPCIVKPLKKVLTNLRLLYRILKLLNDDDEVKGQNIKKVLREYLSYISAILSSTPPSILRAISTCIEDPNSCTLRNSSIDFELILKAIETSSQIIESMLRHRDKIVIPSMGIIENSHRGPVLIIPDPYTYIQASGRCSRLLRGKKTFGISIVVDHRYRVDLLESALRRLLDEVTFRHLPYDEKTINELKLRIEESRSIEESSTTDSDLLNNIKTALIIVESPTKARTIARMFGRPAKRIVGLSTVYESIVIVDKTRVYVSSIVATLGHITDLVTDEGIHGVKIVNGRFVPVYDFISKCTRCKRQFVGVENTCPYCGSNNIVSAFSIFNVLRKIALEVDEVLIGTDPDIEGEKIAFDIYNLLSRYNGNIRRIEFHEVTRRAFIEALKNPHTINLHLVKAQIVRRIDDRWIGFELSMWLQDVFNKPWLGIGRVQGPILKWIVERYQDYKKSKGYRLYIELYGYRVSLFLEYPRDEVEKIVNSIKNRGLLVEDISLYRRIVEPPPPFTTDELLIEACRNLKLAASQVMKLAQDLFELGLITYHRTDSTRVSSVGIAIAKSIIEKLGLKEEFTPRQWSKTTDSGAHEAIRPTQPLLADEVYEKILDGSIGLNIKITPLHLKVYDLIVKRFIASQLPSAEVAFLKARLRIPDSDIHIEIEVPVKIASKGFTAVYPFKVYPEVLDLERNKIVFPENINVKRCSRYKLYTQYDIVKLMRDHGIGRPSTYAKAIENVIRHGYAILSKKKRALIPTKLGLGVYALLFKYFKRFVDVETTRRIEEIMVLIERGLLSHEDVLKNLLQELDEALNTVKSIPQNIISSLSDVEVIHV